jgi:single-strand DNA-binding protein
VEKYSTEIVLQRFRGELTMLGGRGDGAPAGAGGGDDYGASQGGGGFSGGGRAQGSGPRESFSADLDDEIPF